jgi:hypothetical protein
VDYNTRNAKSDSISFHNLPDLETGDKQGNRYTAIAYAEERQEEEAGKRGDRNHYRMILSFDRDVSTSDAKDLAHKYLEKEFPNAKAVVAVHQHKKAENHRGKERDGKHTHVHVWIDARETTGKKIHMKSDRLPQLYKSWQTLYDREYGTNYAQEFGAKRAETANWKQERDHAKENGLPMPAKPERVADSFGKKEIREKDLREQGVENEQNRTDLGERFITSGFEQADRTASATLEVSGAVDAGKQAIDRGAGALDGRAIAVEQAVSRIGNEVAAVGRGIEKGRVDELEGLREGVARSLNQEKEVERGGGIER